MFKAYFHAALMSKYEHTIALGPAKSLRPNKPVLIIMHRLESEPERQTRWRTGTATKRPSAP
jgi:hypothetical protein